MKTGLCTIAFRELPFEQVLDLAVSAGFDGVEPWGKPGHTPDPFDAGTNVRTLTTPAYAGAGSDAKTRKKIKGMRKRIPSGHDL